MVQNTPQHIAGIGVTMWDAAQDGLSDVDRGGPWSPPTATIRTPTLSWPTRSRPCSEPAR